MENFKELYRNGHQIKNNINHFTSFYESDYKEGTKNRMKPENPKIVLSEKEKGKKN